MFVAVAQSLALPLVALYSQELGAAPQAIGLVLGVGFVLPVLAAVSIADWVDRIGARRMVVAGAIGLAVAPVIPWIEPSLIALAAMQVVMGVAHLGSVVAAQSYVARIGGPRERNFGWYTTFVSVGQLAGPFVLGLALESTGYPGALATSAAVGVAAAGLAVGLRPLGDADAPAASAAPGASRKRDLASSRPLRLALVASGATLFALGSTRRSSRSTSIGTGSAPARSASWWAFEPLRRSSCDRSWGLSAGSSATARSSWASRSRSAPRAWC